MDELVLSVDIAPTILALADVVAEGMDGRDLTDLLDSEEPFWRPAFFYEYFAEVIGPQTDIRAYRSNRYKLIKYSADASWTEFSIYRTIRSKRTTSTTPRHSKRSKAGMEADIDHWIGQQP